MSKLYLITKSIVIYIISLISLLFLVIIFFHLSLFFIYKDKVYRGVSFMGNGLSGSSISSLERDLEKQFDMFEDTKMAFFVDEFSFRISLSELNLQFDKDEILNNIEKVGRSSNIVENLRIEIGALLYGYDVQVDFDYDQDSFSQIAQVIDTKVNQEAKEGSLIIEEGRIIVSETVVRRKVDIEKLEQNFIKVVSDLETKIEVPVTKEKVEIENDVLYKKAEEAKKLVASDLVIFYGDKTWTIKKEDFGNFLSLDLKKEKGNIELAPMISNEQYLQNFLTQIAPEIEIAMQEAIIKEIDGKKFALKFPKDGKIIDTNKSIGKIWEAFTLPGEKKIELVITEINSEELAKQGIIDVSTLISSGQSTFPAGPGQASRVHNIQTAAGKLHDYVVGPGEVFSVVDGLGEISTQTGYWGGLALIGGRYAPAVGGGVCEVSTDVFRAALYGGYEIVSRKNHSAVIFHYDWPQRGLDATIFPSAGLDFKFKNNTEYYIVIQTNVDAAQGMLTVDFYSSSKDREVTISGSTVYNVLPPGNPFYITDKSLAKGQTIMSEVPAPGCEVDITRTIVENGQTSTDNIHSRYIPWRAVYLVGE